MIIYVNTNIDLLVKQTLLHTTPYIIIFRDNIKLLSFTKIFFVFFKRLVNLYFSYFFLLILYFCF